MGCKLGPIWAAKLGPSVSLAKVVKRVPSGQAQLGSKWVHYGTHLGNLIRVPSGFIMGPSWVKSGSELGSI